MRVADLVEAQRAHLDRIQAQGVAAQLRIVRDALGDTVDRIRGARLGAWGEASEQWTRLMLIDGYRQLGRRMVGRMGADILTATRTSIRDQAHWFRTLDRHFAGAARPLQWDALEWIERRGRAQRQTRLRMYERSFRRYGAASVTKIEDAIAKRVLVGDPWDRAMDEVADAMRHVSEGQEWMVRRTVDTEAAAAYNGAAHEALVAEDTDPTDRMYKRLVAVWDHVTAKDSMLLHGQKRPVREPFYDSYHGRHYDYPPNRPHDREQVVGWRRSWGEDVPHFRAGPDQDGRTKAVRGPTVKPAPPKPPTRPDRRPGLARTGLGLLVTEQLLENRRARDDALRQIAQAQNEGQIETAEAFLAEVEARGRDLERQARHLAAAAAGTAVADGGRENERAR